MGGVRPTDDLRLYYWHRPPTFAAAATAPPLVVLHGIGIGFRVGYAELLTELVAAAGERRTIVAVELPHVRYAPSAPTQARAQLERRT